MSGNATFCPRCETESSGGNRFCRRCGTNLQVVDRALTDTQAGSSLAQSTSKAEDLYKELKSETAWIAVRGIVTLIIALPSFFLFSIAMGTVGWMIMLLPWLVVLVFIVLGGRDLSRSYAMLKDPRTALDALDEKKGEEEAKRWLAEISNSSKGESSQMSVYSLDVKSEEQGTSEMNIPASITEQTTFPLKDSQNEPGAAQTKQIK